MYVLENYKKCVKVYSTLIHSGAKSNVLHFNAVCCTEIEGKSIRTKSLCSYFLSNLKAGSLQLNIEIFIQMFFSKAPLFFLWLTTESLTNECMITLYTLNSWKQQRNNIIICRITMYSSFLSLFISSWGKILFLLMYLRKELIKML